MILRARVRPVVYVRGVRCWTLAERFRRIALSGVGREVEERIVEVGDAVIAGVIRATLVGRGVY